MRAPIQIPNWSKFQRYKRSRPPWIRLYRDLLDKPEWANLSGDAAKLLVELWLKASDQDHTLGGLISTPTKDLAWQLRRPVELVVSSLLELERQGFIIMLVDDVSTTCALGEQSVSPESEAVQSQRTTLSNRAKKKKRASSTYGVEFLEIWNTHRRGPKADAAKAYGEAIAGGVEHDVILRGLKAYVRDELRPDFKGQHLFRWIRDERWEEYQPKAKPVLAVVREPEPEAPIVPPEKLAELLRNVREGFGPSTNRAPTTTSQMRLSGPGRIA